MSYYMLVVTCRTVGLLYNNTENKKRVEEIRSISYLVV